MFVQLIDNYGSDPSPTNAMDKFDFYIMPIVNPDGYKHSYNSVSYDTHTCAFLVDRVANTDALEQPFYDLLYAGETLEKEPRSERELLLPWDGPEQKLWLWMVKWVQLQCTK